MILCGAALLSVAAFSSTASAAQHPFIGTFGPSAQPSFSAARSMAVDESTKDVLVIDPGTQTVKRFHPDGTADDFSALGSNVIDGLGGADKTEPEGFSFRNGETAASETEIAVDNSAGGTKGNIYVTQAGGGLNLVFIFSSTGAYLGKLTASGGGPFEETCGVAVDASGSVYVDDYFSGVHKYVPSGSAPTNADNTANFNTVQNPCTLSAGVGPTAGSLFVASYAGSVKKISAETGEVAYEVSPAEGTTSAVDPSNGHVLIAQGKTVREFDASGATPKVVATITRPNHVEGLAVSAAGGRVYLTESASAGEPVGATSVLEYGPLTAQPPTIEEQQVLSALYTEAEVGAKINPEGSATTFVVEYGPTASYGLTTAPVAVGSDETAHVVAQALAGLQPGATYHFRFVATNSVAPTTGPDQILRTYNEGTIGSSGCPNEAFRIGPARRLSACRAYELVTPIDKGGIDIEASVDFHAESNQLAQTTPLGSALTFSTSQGFGGAEGGSYSPQYLSTRGPTGWQTRPLTTPQNSSPVKAGARVIREYVLFTPDLCNGVLQNYSGTPIAPNAAPGYANLYQRNLCGGGLTGLTPDRREKIQPSLAAPYVTAGISDDGRCVTYFPFNAPSALPAESTREGIRENCGGIIRQVNILPSGEPSEYSFVGDTHTIDQYEVLRTSTLENAMSKDGSTIYWSAPVSDSVGFGPLYVRINAQQEQSALGPEDECLEAGKACTLPVSGTVEEGAAGTFYLAADDGTKAVFEILGGPHEGSIYEFDLRTGSSQLIATDSAGVPPGASADGTRVYFLSTAGLAPGATAGKRNLYLYDANLGAKGEIRFVSELEGPRRSVEVTPNGKQAVINATAQLTAYDNRDAATGEPAYEVYVYDADANGGAGGVTCVSCNPTGQRPRARRIVRRRVVTNQFAAGLIPEPYTSFHAPQAIAESGSTVFFESFEGLLPVDTNGKADVYEWTRLGSGGCVAGSAAFSSQANGCLALVSSGEGSSDSQLIEATPDGSDVFFATDQSLLPQDPGLVDFYDASAGGGFPPPPAATRECEGDSCQVPLAPPAATAPGSSQFGGGGNPKHRRHACRKHGKRCHHNKGKHKRKHGRHANKGRRAAK